MKGMDLHVALTSRALIAVTGEDWRAFLQGQLTQDIDTLAVGECRFGALLTPQGRLLFDMFIVGREDGCWLDVEASLRDALIQRLTMYRLRAKVTFAADDRPIAAARPEPAPKGEGVWVRDPRLPEMGWRGYGVAGFGEEAAYDVHRLRLGVPGPADWGSDRTYPIEANFDLLNGIDFRKGCFVGQETTSRMKRRGAVKNRMLPISFSGAVPPFGAEVLNGERRAGEVLSGRDHHGIALLRLDRLDGELTADGRKISVERPAYALS